MRIYQRIVLGENPPDIYHTSRVRFPLPAEEMLPEVYWDPPVTPCLIVAYGMCVVGKEVDVLFVWVPLA